MRNAQIDTISNESNYNGAHEGGYGAVGSYCCKTKDNTVNCMQTNCNLIY